MSTEVKYPIGGYAPGEYYCTCGTCNEKFIGARRSFQCLPCGTKSQTEWDALTPEQQEERVKKNAEAWKEFMASKEYIKHNLEQQLRVGTSIKIGKHYVEECGGFESGQIITLVQGYFERNNGLYDVTETAPSVWDKSDKEFDSIYHLFGNNLERWHDCEIVKKDDNGQ